jgi:flagellar biosynthesis component FlhA
MIRLVLSLFTGASSLPWIIGGIVALVVAFGGWLAYHDHQIWNKAMNAFNEKQEALVEEKKQEFEKKTVEINDTAERIRAAIAEQQKKESSTAANIIKNTEGGTGQASSYLKSIVKQLEQNYGEKK